GGAPRTPAAAIGTDRDVIRRSNLGLVAGIELEPRPGAVGARAYEVFLKCLERGVLVRYTGDTLAFSPPLIISEAEIARIFDTVRTVLQEVA
ncbi:hypothetical protein ACQUWY_26450, partial [Ralstonia pseudosolanacearum]